MSQIEKQSKIDLIIQSIKDLKAMEICDLVKKIKTEFDLPTLAVAQPVAPTNTTTSEKTEEKSDFDIILESVNTDQKITAIKVLRQVTSLGLKELQEKVTAVINKEDKIVVASALPEHEANNLVKKFEEVGLKVLKS